MLSTDNPMSAVIKLVDFGCAQFTGLPEQGEGEDSSATTEDTHVGLAGKTLAYAPPEILSTTEPSMSTSMDIYAMGVIIYIMLTGLHPFDLTGQASDEDIAKAVVSGESPPLHNSPITAHMSDSAIDLIGKLMEPDPKKRMTASQMLEHEWVKGKTAKRDIIVDSAKKLSMFRAYQSKLQAKVFENLVTWSTDNAMDAGSESNRKSLMEQSYQWFDRQKKGHISEKDLRSLTEKSAQSGGAANSGADSSTDSAQLSLSGFSDLLTESMKSKYFPKGHVIYRGKAFQSTCCKHSVCSAKALFVFVGVLTLQRVSSRLDAISQRRTQHCLTNNFVQKIAQRAT